MDLATLQAEVAVGRTRPLAPGSLYRDLGTFQRELEAETGLQLRLATMNLVVVCSSPEEARGLGPVLRELSVDFPCRCLVAVRDPQAPPGDLVGFASFAAHPVRSSQVCCEQVVVYSAGGEGDSIPSLVLATLAPDLPTLSWWRGEPPFGSALFEQILEPSNRVVFDSHSFPVERLASVLDLVGDRYHQEQAFSDLSWVRMEPWREEIAALFDPPEATRALRDLVRVEIDHRPAPAPFAPQPLLLAGWLASRLGWTLAGTRLEGEVLEARLRGGEVSLRLAPRPGRGEPGEVAGFQATTAEGREFRVPSVRPRRRARSRGPGSGLDEAARRLVGWMGQELSVLTRDAVFQEALEAAVQFVPSGRRPGS